MTNKKGTQHLVSNYDIAMSFCGLGVYNAEPSSVEPFAMNGNDVAIWDDVETLENYTVCMVCQNEYWEIYG